jgi:dihydrolipoamide dehydrogenase
LPQRRLHSVQGVVARGKVIDEVGEMSRHGVVYGPPQIELPKLLEWKNSVVKKLVGGLSMLGEAAQGRSGAGHGQVREPARRRSHRRDGKCQKIRFEQCIIAAGSEAIKLPFIPDDPRVIDSTGALELGGVPKRCWSSAAASSVSKWPPCMPRSARSFPWSSSPAQLMPGADPDLVKPLEKRLKARYEQILLNTKVTGCSGEA